MAEQGPLSSGNEDWYPYPVLTFEFFKASQYIVPNSSPQYKPKDRVMRKAMVATIVVSLSLSFYAFRTYESKSAEFLQKLGISEEIAKDCIWSSISGMYLSNPGGAKLRQTKANERGSLTRDIAAYAKAYTKSEEFKKKYLEYREGLKPAPPVKPRSMAEQKDDQKEQLKKSIKETEENLKKMPSDQQATMKGVVDMLKQQLKSLDDPDNAKNNPPMDAMMTQGYEMQMNEYKKKVAQWEKDNPATPNEMIKRWLTEFLNVSKDIDFDASLIDGDGGKKVFARTEYERRPEKWKMCFRAGKETIVAGRAFAKQWLDELDKEK